MRKVLIVDDSEINIVILKNILQNDYEVLEASNGEAALELLREQSESVSAVLLDIVMPVMDGYQVLAAMRSDEALLQIPVIVTTGGGESGSEVKALTLGANDYIVKPYNPDTIKRRLWNTINLRETAAIANAARVDALTGFFSRSAFLEKAAELIAVREAGYYVMACFDIDGFKLVNDQYGSAKGDEVLKQIADIFRESFEKRGGICCRVMADNFAVLYPRETLRDTDLAEIRRAASVLDGSILPVSYSVGRYIVNDLSLSAGAMYDRALIAKESVKGRFDVHVAVYDESMRKRILREQEIISEMNIALEKRHFEVWFQPQYNHSSGALIGAEALVRWRHPVRGLIPPGDFIPVFEKNGFIYELDKYVWEQVCVYLRKWLDEGRSPLPVSVNISRYDLFREDLVIVLKGLVDRYRLPVELLRLEITESAFAKSAEQIINVVKRMIASGFTVEIDDFGSGYSSLNTLKDVPANVLKLDMRFLESNENSQRGGNILESVVRMAKWLNMSVIAEGVEEKEQADFLKSIGCNYVQGFYYAKPMPAAEYEALAPSFRREERLSSLETVENLDNNAFWNPKSMDTLIFNSYIGGACIFEYHDGGIEMLRANDKYAQVIGSAGMTIEDALKLNWAEHLDAGNTAAVKDALRRSIDTGDEVTAEFLFLDLPGCPTETYLRSTMRVIVSSGDRYLVYCTNENMTAQRQAELKEKRATEQLQAIMSNIKGGVTASVVRD